MLKIIRYGTHLGAVHRVLTGSVKFVGQPYYFHHRDYLSGLALDHQECDSSNDPSARLAV